MGQRHGPSVKTCYSMVGLEFCNLRHLHELQYILILPVSDTNS